MIDIHVHFFPPKIFQAIWRYFEDRSHRLWRVNYKLYGHEHVQTLKDAGVERFTALVYAHKAELADYLNGFVRESAARFPELIPFGTVFAGDGQCEQVARRIFEEYQFFGIKLHPFVSNENLDDPRFFPVYETMQALGKVLICHPGSGPVYQQADGAMRLRNVLSLFSRLKTVIAHCGAFEYGEYRALAEDFEYVYFDTAMNCVHTEVFSNNCPGREFFLQYQDRILFGSDFPNIPYAYADQVAAVRQFNLGETVERKIFHENALNLLELKESEASG